MTMREKWSVLLQVIRGLWEKGLCKVFNRSSNDEWCWVWNGNELKDFYKKKTDYKENEVTQSNET